MRKSVYLQHIILERNIDGWTDCIQFRADEASSDDVYIKTDEELEELQSVLSDYFARKVDREMDGLWHKGIISEQTIEQWGKEHMRTPYK